MALRIFKDAALREQGVETVWTEYGTEPRKFWHTGNGGRWWRSEWKSHQPPPSADLELQLTVEKLPRTNN